jgi:hypothetical protein
MKYGPTHIDALYRSMGHGSGANLRYDGAMAPWGKRMFSSGKKNNFNVMDALGSESSNSTSTTLRAIGWTSAALAVTALGLYIGRELRIRYKFKRRTPSDFFSHAGEEMGAEYGMGV